MPELDPILLLPLALVLLLMALPVVSRRVWGPVSYVQMQDVFESLNDGRRIKLIDIRRARAYRNGTLPGAVNVPAKDVEAYIAENIAPDTPVALVCDSDLTSTRCAARLRKRGVANVSVMKGGMHAWTRAKLPVTRDS